MVLKMRVKIMIEVEGVAIQTMEEQMREKVLK